MAVFYKYQYTNKRKNIDPCKWDQDYKKVKAQTMPLSSRICNFMEGVENPNKDICNLTADECGCHYYYSLKQCHRMSAERRLLERSS